MFVSVTNCITFDCLETFFFHFETKGKRKINKRNRNNPPKNPKNDKTVQRKNKQKSRTFIVKL